MLRFLTSGESHGKALTAILEGMVANLPLAICDIESELLRRKMGYGRGGRMKIEEDKIEILSGIRFGRTLGSPICLFIENKDWPNWQEVMRAEPGKAKPVTNLRPGHADLAGILKYNQKDIRNILERASARETAARVAIGAIAKKLLCEFDISVKSEVLHIGGEKSREGAKKLIDRIKEKGDTLGGEFRIIVENPPPGLGSFMHYDRRLDGILAQAVMSVPAVKGVEIGLGFKAASLTGSKVHDEIYYKNRKFSHRTNNAGGLEGGVTNGEAIVLQAAMKPISTLKSPLSSVDIETKKKIEAHVERSDVCAVESAAVIGEAVVAFEIAKSLLEKFGGDSLEELKDNFETFQKRLSML